MDESMVMRIKHRDKNSTSTQQPDLPAGKARMSLVATESALPSKVSYMARTIVF